jgi:hypothetical protein
MFLLASCAASAPPTTVEQTSATTSETTAEDPNTSSEPTTDTNPGSAPQVTTGADGITVTGSGNGETSAIAFDKPYYIVTTTNAAAAEYGSVMVTVKGQEIPTIMSMAAEHTSVFQPDGGSVAFTIEATGGYVLKFANPPSTSGAVAAPQTFKGAEGTTVTPVVSTRGTYVRLSLKYLGTPDEDAPSGAMLATAQIYDASTGDSVLNVPKYVNKAKTEDSDGNTRDKPGTYFLIVTGASAEDSWEASITEE